MYVATSYLSYNHYYTNRNSNLRTQICICCFNILFSCFETHATTSCLKYAIYIHIWPEREVKSAFKILLYIIRNLRLKSNHVMPVISNVRVCWESLTLISKVRGHFIWKLLCSTQFLCYCMFLDSLPCFFKISQASERKFKMRLRKII